MIDAHVSRCLLFLEADVFMTGVHHYPPVLVATGSGNRTGKRKHNGVTLYFILLSFLIFVLVSSANDTKIT